MANYVKFRDVAAVITAGNQLTSAGEAFAGALRDFVGTDGGGSISAMEKTTLTGHDSYSEAFDETYRKPQGDKPRNVALLSYAADLAKPAQDIGPSVVQAAETLTYVDMVNGATIAKALSEDGKS